MPGTVVITGASSGFGEAFALARKTGVDPSRVTTYGASDSELLLQGRFMRFQCGAESIHKFAVAAELETPEILINNAGGALGRAPVAEVEDDDLVGMIEANLTGLLRMTRELLPGLIRRKKGHVINISSLAAHGVYEGGGVYAPVKHAVRAVSQALRLELSGTDVRVTDVAPGMAETEFSVVRLGSEEKAKSVYAGMRPLTAQDVSDVVVWAATRPPHVNIDELLIKWTDQAGLTKVHRR